MKRTRGVGVPAVQVLGLREVGVAAEQHLAEAAPEADRQGAIDFGGGAFVRGPVAGAVDQAQTSPVLASVTTSGW